MRFDSIASLYTLLGVLGIQGYSVPFANYEKLLKDKGFIKHIHNYKCIIEAINSKTLSIQFHDKDNKFEIIIERKEK